MPCNSICAKYKIKKQYRVICYAIAKNAVIYVNEHVSKWFVLSLVIRGCKKAHDIPE